MSVSLKQRPKLRGGDICKRAEVAGARERKSIAQRATEPDLQLLAKQAQLLQWRAERLERKHGLQNIEHHELDRSGHGGSPRNICNSKAIRPRLARPLRNPLEHNR